jgi:hypothetical protein
MSSVHYKCPSKIRQLFLTFSTKKSVYPLSRCYIHTYRQPCSRSRFNRPSDWSWTLLKRFREYKNRRCLSIYEGEKKKKNTILFIYCLFNDEASSLEHTASAAGWLGNNEFGRMWKEAIVSWFHILLLNLPVGTKQNHKTHQSRYAISGPWFESGTSETGSGDAIQ